MGYHQKWTLPWMVGIWVCCSSFVMFITAWATTISPSWKCIVFGIYAILYSIFVFTTEFSAFKPIPFIGGLTEALNRQPYWVKTLNYAFGSAPMFACLKASAIVTITLTLTNAAAYLMLFIVARDTDPTTSGNDRTIPQSSNTSSNV